MAFCRVRELFLGCSFVTMKARSAFLVKGRDDVALAAISIHDG
jgi:hypothetical protein